MTVYVVTCENWRDEEYYVVGVFTDPDVAEKVSCSSTNRYVHPMPLDLGHLGGV